MRAFGRLLPIATARARLERAVTPVVRTERVKLSLAAGRVAARTVRAPRPVPPVDRASWDGYAVRSADTVGASRGRPISLRLVEELYAEDSSRRRVGAGETVAVATGASLPPGTDAVAIFEEVVKRGRSVRLFHPVRPGEKIAKAGHDLATGTVLVRAGEPVGPATVGALAACGVASLEVYARPVVALVASGNELKLPGERLGLGGVYECNLPSIAAVVAAAGGVPRILPPVPDDPRKIEAVLRRALRSADMVVASGGSSVGERDHLPRIFPKLGSLLFHGLAVRPGKPTLAARAGPKVLLGLPGHPASCLSNMYWLVLPALRRLARQPGPGWTERDAVLTGPDLARTPGLATVVPLERTGDRVRTTFRGSSAITSLRAATGFVILPPGSGAVRAGARLRVADLDLASLRGGAPSS